MLKRIGSIKLGVYSPEQIRKMSVIEIKTADLYDKDGFPIEGGLMDPHLGLAERGRRCKTCGQTVEKCIGHFGRLELVRPVIHVGFFKKVDFLVNTTCRSCGRLLFSDDEIKGMTAKNLDAEELHRIMLIKVKSKTTCPHCETQKLNTKLDPPTNFYTLEKEGDLVKLVRLFPNQIREWFVKIPSSDLEKIGLKNVRPEWFILTVLPIPPVNVHPPITLDNGLKSEDDLTYKLSDIVTVNNRLRDNINAGTPQLIIEDLWMLLQYNITTYINNNSPGVPPAKHRSGRLLKTIIQRIKGKGGLIRNNLMGKRVNYAARTTISPDMYIDVDEIGVPKEIAETLTLKDKITKYNLDFYKDLLKNKSVIKYVIRPDGARKKVSDELKEQMVEELAPKYIVERCLQNGDLVLFNRQPTLHRASIMAHKVKVTKGNTFRINGSATQPYNADFDGDEMNLHVPQTPEGIMETKQLISLKEQIISPRQGTPHIVLMEDAIAGTFMLTFFDMKIPRDLAMYYFQMLGIEEPPSPDCGAEYSGKSIFSAMLPKEINMVFESSELSNIMKKIDPENPAQKIIKKDSIVNIENGILKSGCFGNSGVGKSSAKIVQEIYDVCGPEAALEFLNKLGRISLDVATRFGLSLGLKDYDLPKTFDSFKEDQLEQFFKETRNYEKKYKEGKLDKVPGKSIKDSFEFYMVKSAGVCKDNIEKFILNQKIGDLFGPHSKYGALVLALSGAKGSAVNLTNVSGLWGQVAVREKRPTRGYTARTMSMYKRGDEGALAKGFVVKNFYKGLSAREAFFHAMGGREGEVDTSVATKVSGYLYRRVSNALRDISVAPDRSVRTADNKIIQYLYGDDGVYTQKTYKHELFTENRLKQILGKVN
ncbi:MAG: DNA-directed RNA polymerase subunit A' [Candidatus Diapherotrites archaeon CG08_land_8_20_14_0_20_30_16]|nr:MAG: DNA-directed RNA polymerase subunit A' [Candidatus Diapherotrites archaeon CG08_land_8_20_14_0_20_30_16]